MICRLLSLIALSLAFSAPTAQAAQPNVLVILADDQGWGDLSVNGNTNLATPNIDSLARDGAMLDRFYVCPVCAPTRSEFMTARFYGRTGVHGVSTGQERLNLDETTIAQVFKAGGYSTAAFGKWHNGMQSPYHPNDRGFEEFYGFCSGHWGHYFDTDMDHNGQLVKGKGFIIDDLTDHALAFIDQHKDRPFFCYVPYNTPHSPMQVPDKFYQKFANADLKLRAKDESQEDLLHTRAALAMCENIDWNVGRLLKHLDDLKLAENTIVIYFSDNGPNGWRWNDRMKGRKGTVDEGGVRSPFMIRWPGKIKAGLKVPQIAGAIDLLPTLSELCAVDFRPSKPIDGRSLKPLLFEENTATWPERQILSLRTGGKGPMQVSVRTQQYRLDPTGALFDMVADPEQEKNIAAQHADEVSHLTAIAKNFANEVSTVVQASKDRPYTVGYSDVTPLPARDGEPHGGLQRSARAPNCSFFTHWTSTDDSATWDIEVGTAGDYEVIAYQTCAAANVGVEMQVSFEGQTTSAKVTEAWDPALVGESADRSSRGNSESYVKDFRPVSLGTLKMAKARGLLTLRATQIPGPGAIDVRYLMLKKLK